MRALITGVCGQDGSYLTEFLQSKNYEVIGLSRHVSRDSFTPNVELIKADVVTAKVPQVDEIYHLAAQSHVGVSFKDPKETLRVNVLGTQNMLDQALEMGAKFYQASTSELFGNSPAPQNELTLMRPRSPYGVSKLAAYWSTIHYREAYDLPTYNGILFNHESPRRGQDFVTQKVVKALKNIRERKQDYLELGNLEAKRDWGHAKDYVRAMWLMMQNEPGEYVVATGETRSVKDFVDVALKKYGLYWGVVKSNPDLFRPSEVDELCGDASKIRSLGWVPEYSFNDLVEDMCESV